MSDDAKPKRKFWQFHLSTTVLIIIFLSGLMWLETRASNVTEQSAGFWRAWTWYGWPFHAVACLKWEESLFATRISPINPGLQFNTLNVGLDFFFVVLTILTLAFLSEFIIHRREIRKP